MVIFIYLPIYHRPQHCVALGTPTPADSPWPAVRVCCHGRAMACSSWQRRPSLSTLHVPATPVVGQLQVETLKHCSTIITHR